MNRAICENIRELYRYLVKEGIDADDLIRDIYIAAKKMNAKLEEYRNGTRYVVQEEKWANELTNIKKEAKCGHS